MTERPNPEPTRVNRDQTTRVEEAREPYTFVPSGRIPDFNKDPAWEYRWVRASHRNELDTRNVNKRMREGWTMVSASEVPELKAFMTSDVRFEGYVEVDGLILCKIPRERVVARNKYFAELTARQMEGVDNDYMRENDSRMPVFRQRRTQVTRGSTE